MKYVLKCLQTGKVLSKTNLSKKEADAFNYAFGLNGVRKRYITAASLLAKFASYKNDA